MRDEFFLFGIIIILLIAVNFITVKIIQANSGRERGRGGAIIYYTLCIDYILDLIK